jgi:hypothetical protein
MRNVTDYCGRNAGDIWQILHSNGPLTETKLMELTNLSEDEFFAAVGWLARENKICKNGLVYQLGDTNLSTKIGTDAGKVWRVLETRGIADIYDIARLTQMMERDAFTAVGWLAREDKVDAHLAMPREFQIKTRRY